MLCSKGFALPEKQKTNLSDYVEEKNIGLHGTFIPVCGNTE